MGDLAMAYTRIIENLVLKDTLRLEGSAYNNTLVRNVTISGVNGDGILLRNVSNVRIENVKINNVSGTGIKLSTEGSTSNVKIVNNTITNIGKDGILGGRRQGVDHLGVEIVGNTIANAGYSGNSGLLHGIYMQSSEFLLERNRIYDSTDGNGITVRSSGVVRGNYIEDSDKSGIAYFADHPAGSSDRLVIENNIVVASGLGANRSDIDLIGVQGSQAALAVGRVVVRGNTLTDNDGKPIVVDPSYARLGIVVENTGNSVVSEAAARKLVPGSGGGTTPPPTPEPEPQPETAEAGLKLEAGSSARTNVVMTLDDSGVGTVTAARTTTPNAKLDPLAMEVSAVWNGSASASLGLDSGRLGVASPGESSSGTSALSGSEMLIFNFKAGAGLGDGVRLEMGLSGATVGETVVIEAYRDGVLVGQSEVDARGTITFAEDDGFDSLRLRAGAGDEFSFSWMDVDRVLL